MPGPSSGSSSLNARPYAKDRQRPTALPVIFHPRPFPSRSILESSFGFKLFLISAVCAFDFDATGDDCSMSIQCIRNAGTVPCLPLSYLLHAAACVPPFACQCPALNRCWSRRSSLALRPVAPTSQVLDSEPDSSPARGAGWKGEGRHRSLKRRCWLMLPPPPPTN